MYPGKKTFSFARGLAVPAETQFSVIQEPVESKDDRRKWCRDVTVIASLCNYTASLSINRKLHSSDKKTPQKTSPQFVQNRLRCPIHATFTVRDLRLLRACLHVQVFVAFRYALQISTWRISIQDAVVFGNIIPFCEGGIR